LGCKHTFQLNALPLIAGTILSAKAGNFEMMVFGRILVGIGIGVSSGVVPLYISEVSPTEIRGTMGTLNQLFICVGILVALIAGLPLGDIPAWWRNMFGIATVPAVLLALGMAYCPESPRWLYKQGRTADAEIAVRKLWGKAVVDSSMADLKAGNVETVKGDNQDAGWGELFGKRYRKVVTVGMARFLFQQFAGINAVVYFSTQVFRSAGITSDVAASALVGAANVIGTTVASSMMDKSGRRTLLMGSYAGMSLAMLLLSLALSWSALTPYSGTLAVLGTVVYVIAFSLGAGPVPALLLPEIFGARIRAKAVSLSLGVHWICNFIIGLMFLSVVQRLGVSTVYLFFAAVCAAAVVFVNGSVVETKGRSLEDIERELCPAV
jgi:sugar porter (SP) family MFS transporter